MMRILHHTTEWLPGTMTWLKQLISDTDSLVHNHVFAETRHPNSPALTNLHVSRESNPVRFWASKALKKATLIRYSGPDTSNALRVKPHILHSHFGHVGAMDIPLAKKLGIPHVVSFYGMDVHQLPYGDAKWMPLYRDLFASGAHILCEGEFMRDSIIKLGALPRKVHVHRLGVDVGRIRFQPRKIADGEVLRILMASAFRPKKGITYGIEAVAKASKTIPIQLTIIGDAADAQSEIEKSRIDASLRILKLGSQIRRIGFVPHSELLSQALAHHVYLAPSVTATDGDCEGGAPVSLIEMGASGMVIASTRHCDIPGVITHGETGWLADERDTDALAKKLIRIWETRQVWEPSQIALRQHIETSFHNRTQATELVRLYERFRGHA